MLKTVSLLRVIELTKASIETLEYDLNIVKLEKLQKGMYMYLYIYIRIICINKKNIYKNYKIPNEILG